MDKEIESLYSGSKEVSVAFKAKEIELAGYEVSGLNDTRKLSPKIWEMPGVVEGSFYFYIQGKVTRPSMWEGYKADFGVNGLGSEYRVNYEQEGSLGYGFCENEKVFIRLYVKPQIAKDILDEIIYYRNYSQFAKDSDPAFGCDLVNIKRGGIAKHEGAITFEIGAFRC